MMKQIQMRLFAGVLSLLPTVAVFGQTATEQPVDGMFPPRAATPALTASSPTTVHDYAWYEGKTYTWTDASNRTHEARLTDEATDPYQMFDLLKWVYCNPEIPGNKYDAVTGKATYYGAQSVYHYSSGSYKSVEPGWGFTDSDVTAPDEDGHTLFLIKLKNYTETFSRSNWTTNSKAGLINYFTKYVESVKVITDGLRAGTGDNAGTMFNIEATMNRFFIIGKGKSYYWTPLDPNSSSYPSTGILPPFAPFYNMFEEYSPTTTDKDVEITDFYQKMNEGEVYPVVHDCGSVIVFDHYFSMAGSSSTEEKSMSGMIFFIPDNRNAYASRNYVTGYQPQVGMYVISLDAEAQPNDEQEHKYDVTLDWTSSLNTVAGSTVPQTYTIYIIKTDEQGNEYSESLTVTGETTYTYTVDQLERSYTVRYVVYGTAAESEAFHALSNVADVVIPGYDDFMVLNANHYESDYVLDEQNNYYRNFLTLDNEEGVTRERINNGENEYKLYRCYVDGDTVMEPVATITFTLGTNDRTHYQISYDDQQMLDGYTLAEQGIATEGWLNADDNEVVDMSPITLVDQFAASTAANTHPAVYGYIVIGNAEGKSLEEQKMTNSVSVYVHKSDAAINGYYTKNEVDNEDLDHSLDVNVKSADVEMPLSLNKDVYFVDLMRGNAVNPDTRIAHLQHDGFYYTDHETSMGNYGKTYSYDAFDMLDSKLIANGTNDFVTYVPVIRTYNTARVKNGTEDTYGAAFLRTGVGAVSASVQGTRSTSANLRWKDENNEECALFSAALKVEGFVPENASATYVPYMYRVWRLCDGVRGYKVDDMGNIVNDPTASRADDCLAQWEETGSSEVNLADDGLSFGALADSKTSFLVRFYYVKQNNGANDVDDMPMYYVVETLLSDIQWTDADPTGIEEIVVDDATRVYVNPQGVVSDKPFDGMNIVITRSGNGATSVTKMVR